MSPGYTITDGQLDVLEPPVKAERASPSAWLKDALEQISAIATLPANWDGNKGLPPNSQILHGGYFLLDCLARVPDVPKPHINPTRDGGVQFEWESESRYFEIEVVAPGAASYLYQDEAAGVEEEGEVFVEESLYDVVHYILQVAQ